YHHGRQRGQSNNGRARGISTRAGDDQSGRRYCGEERGYQSRRDGHGSSGSRCRRPRNPVERKEKRVHCLREESRERTERRNQQREKQNRLSERDDRSRNQV